jgi:DNA-binding MarR family transcriptional regulator
MKMTRAQLIQHVARRIAILQSAAEELDVAAAERLAVNRTDLRCMSVLFLGGPTTAKNLAAATRLTPGAFTTVLDRLERAGYALRVPDEKDRRRVNVELTVKAMDAINALWGPVEQEGVEALGHYSDDELAVILGFLERSIDLQVRHTTRIRNASTGVNRSSRQTADGEVDD